VGLALLGELLVACGGSATHNPDDLAEAGTGATGASAAGSNAGGPGSNAGGSGSAPQWLADAELDEKFPWFVQTRGGDFQTAPDDRDPSLVHVSLAGMPVEATISTHNHLRVVDIATAIEFAAWASEPLTMLVSVRGRLDNADYFAARAAGHHWPVAPLELSTKRQQFTVPFADMVPAEAPGNDIPSFMIGFVVEKPVASVELWLDDVHFL
jgi:hypothetical protein